MESSQSHHMQSDGQLPGVTQASKVVLISYRHHLFPLIFCDYNSLLQSNNLNKQMISSLSLQTLADRMKSPEMTEKALRFATKNYLLNEKDFRSVTPALILQLITLQYPQPTSPSSQTTRPSELTPTQCKETSWHPNQFKIFAWISVCYAFITNRDIQEFNQKDMDSLRLAFPAKDPLFLEYNLRSLVKQDRTTKQDWQEDEVQLLQAVIMKETLKGKWSDISFLLFAQSDRKYYRSSHKCREKWYNHLDPVVRHQKWTLDEDLQLFELIAHIGQRWAAISKAMSGARTEHMVKNRFNSIYKKYAARYQRSSFKKIVEIIIKDLRKKLNPDPVEAKDHKDIIVKTEQPQLELKEQFEEMKRQHEPSEPQEYKQKSSTALEILPQWQDYIQYEELGLFIEEEECIRTIYMKQKIELIDYCMLELQHCPALLQ